MSIGISIGITVGIPIGIPIGLPVVRLTIICVYPVDDTHNSQVHGAEPAGKVHGHGGLPTDYADDPVAASAQDGVECHLGLACRLTVVVQRLNPK